MMTIIHQIVHINKEMEIRKTKWNICSWKV